MHILVNAVEGVSRETFVPEIINYCCLPKA